MSISWPTKADGPMANGDNSELTVVAIGNHVYFYADVNPDRVLAMMEHIRRIDSRLRGERLTRGISDDAMAIPIWLHIYSGGGDLFAAFAAADQLMTVQTPIYSVIEGHCSSAATLLSLACIKRYILPNSFMLIHQISSGRWGKYDDLQDQMHLLDMAMQKFIGFYSNRTKLKKRQVEQLLKRDSWFDAEKCLELGLVDEILVPGKH
jgi:ATP-dependent protease ClpP protease subunit